MTDLIEIAETKISNSNKLTIIAGLNVLEDDQQTVEVAEKLKKIIESQGNPFIFKASFDKANRSSIDSYRGPGLEKGLEIFKELKKSGYQLITDIHEISQVEKISEVIDIIQIPAFLCRQSDIISAAVNTRKTINVKKGQFMAPWDVKNIVEKVDKENGDKLLLTERGSSFGYNNLVSDMTSIPIMQDFGVPVIFDATHSVQQPGGLGEKSGGQREFVEYLARAAVAVGVAGVFIETHQDPDNAPSDGPNMVPLNKLENLLKQLTDIDNLIKN